MQKWPDGHGVPWDVLIHVQQSPFTWMSPQYPTPTTQAPSLPLSRAVPGCGAADVTRVPSARTALPRSAA